MAWIYLMVAGLFEIGFTTSLKLSEGFSKTIPTMSFGVFAILSFWMLNKSLDAIPLGIAYAVWTGIGAGGTVLVGALFFNDYLGYWEIFFLCTLVGSILGLKIGVA